MAHIFLSYARDDKAYVERILSDLHKAGHTSWYDKRAIQLGEDWQFAIARGIADADVVLLALSFQAAKSEWVNKELEIAYGQHKLVFPLILEAMSEESFPEVIRRTKANGVLLYKDYQEGLRKLLSDLRGASAGGRRIPFEVDHPRLPQFAGRDHELRELHRVLKQPGPAGSQPAGVFGMGGVGKTQLVVEYAHRYRYFYPDGVFLLNAAADWASEFARLSARRQLDGGDPSAPGYRDKMAAAMAAHLRERPNALLIFDNVLDPADIRRRPIALGLLPVELPCQVLFTTRKRFPTNGLVPLEIGLLPPEVARELLTRTRLDLQSETEEADETCRVLGYLPLALELAAAFLAKKPKASLRYYRESLRDRGADATHAQSSLKTADLDAYYAASLTPALEAQWGLLENPESGNLLRVAAVFESNTRIPVDRIGLMTALVDNPDGVVTPLADAIADAAAANLIEILEGGTLRLHPLVSDFIRRRETTDPGPLLGRAVQNVMTAYEQVDVLERHCAQRGIQAILEDLLSMRVLLGTWRDRSQENDGARLLRLLRVVQRESHHLREWTTETRPAFFAQQIYNRAAALHHDVLTRSALAHLSRLSKPHLIELWRAANDSPETELVLASPTSIAGVAVTPDDSRIVSVDWKGTLIVWDLWTGQAIRTLPTGYGWIHDLALTDGGNTAFTVSGQGALLGTNIDTGESVQTIIVRWVSAVAVIPGSGRVICGDENGSIHFVDLHTREIVTVGGHEGRIWKVAVTKDAQNALSASDDQTIRLWDVTTKSHLETLRAHTGPVRGLAVTNGSRYVSCSSDGTLKLWDIEGKQTTLTLPKDSAEGHTKAVSSVAVTADGARAVSASADRSVRVWNLAAGKLERTLWGHSRSVNAVALTSDGLRVVSGSNDGILRVWNLAESSGEPILAGHGDIATAVALTPDGSRAVSASKERTLKVWDVNASRHLRTIPLEDIIVRRLAITPDGRFAVTVLSDGRIKRWDLQSSAETTSTLGGARQMERFVVSDDGRQALGVFGVGEIGVWDLETCSLISTLRHEKGLQALALSTGAQYAAIADSEGVAVWDLGARKAIAQALGWGGGDEGVLAITPDGQYLASAGYGATEEDHELRIRRLDTGATAVIPCSGNRFVHVVSTWDSTRFITISARGILQVWDVRQAREDAAVFLDDELWDVAVASDGCTLVAGDRTGTVYCLKYDG